MNLFHIGATSNQDRTADKRLFAFLHSWSKIAQRGDAMGFEKGHLSLFRIYDRYSIFIFSEVHQMI